MSAANHWQTVRTERISAHGIGDVNVIFTERRGQTTGDRQMEWNIKGPSRSEVVIETVLADGGVTISSEVRTGTRVETVGRRLTDRSEAEKRTVAEGGKKLSVRKEALQGGGAAVDAIFLDTEKGSSTTYAFDFGAGGKLKARTAVAAEVEREVAQAVEVLAASMPLLEKKVELLKATDGWQTMQAFYEINEGGVKKEIGFSGRYDVAGGSFTEKWRVNAPSQLEEVQYVWNFLDRTTMKTLQKWPDSTGFWRIIAWTGPDSQRITTDQKCGKKDITTTAYYAPDGTVHVTQDVTTLGQAGTKTTVVETETKGGFAESSSSFNRQRYLFHEGLSLRRRVQDLEGRIITLQRTVPNRLDAGLHREFKAYLQSFRSDLRTDAR